MIDNQENLNEEEMLNEEVLNQNEENGESIENQETETSEGSDAEEKKEDSVEEQLAKAQAQVEEYKDKYLRQLAEFDNFRRRVMKEKAELIKNGHVSVNGEVRTDPSVRIVPGDRVTLDGKAVEPPRGYVYVMLHKPRGYVCTAEDPHAPKKALDLIDLPGVRLVSAGRLDKNSEGLILFSNDGAWIEQLTHPRHGTRKTYQVTTDKPLSSADIRRLTTAGVQNDGETLRAISIRAEAPGRYVFILGEGKNREIRRMLESLDNRTRRLKRIAVGALRLGGLPMGQWRTLSPAEALLALGENASGK